MMKHHLTVPLSIALLLLFLYGCAPVKSNSDVSRADSSDEEHPVVSFIRNAAASVVFIFLFAVDYAGADKNSEVSRVDSPDGKHSAVTFVRNGGATVSFSTEISIIKPNAVLSGGVGNIFICDSDHGKAAYLANNSQWLTITWRSPSELVVRYDEKARIYRKIEKYKAIKIHYEPVVPPKITN